MRASISVNDFTQSHIFLSFIQPKVVEIFTRQFKFNVIHSKNTLPDYLNQAFKLGVKIHRKLPHRNVLVFLTGKKKSYKYVKN